jgi:hypothetical protein
LWESTPASSELRAAGRAKIFLEKSFSAEGTKGACACSLTRRSTQQSVRQRTLQRRWLKFEKVI